MNFNGGMESQTQIPALVLTRDQVAGLLQVRSDTVTNLHRMGELRGVLIGRHLRWRLGDVENYVRGLGPGGHDDAEK